MPPYESQGKERPPHSSLKRPPLHSTINSEETSYALYICTNAIIRSWSSKSPWTKFLRRSIKRITLKSSLSQKLSRHQILVADRLAAINNGTRERISRIRIGTSRAGGPPKRFVKSSSCCPLGSNVMMGFSDPSYGNQEARYFVSRSCTSMQYLLTNAGQT